jgi:hypothetical protein
VIVAVLETATALDVTVKVAVLAPAATVTDAAVVATAVLLLDRCTEAPPVGAGPFSVTVPVAVLPPVTVVGESAMDWSATAVPTKFTPVMGVPL